MSLSGSFSGAGNDLGKLLEVMVSDDKFGDKMKELAAAEAAAKAVIDLVGPAESIPVLHEKAKAALSEAEASLIASRNEASDLIASAKAEADAIMAAAAQQKASAAVEAESIITKAQSDSQRLRTEASAIIGSANADRSRVAAEEAVLAERIRKIEEREAACVSRETSAAAVKASYEDKFNRTRAIWSGLE